MKKLKGAKLGTPSAATVETQAMGRGTTQPMRSLYEAVTPMTWGSSSMEVSVRVGEGYLAK
jgi:hypothetical protein